MAEGQGKGALAGAGKGAALGATLGSVIPGVGNLVGAGVGAIGGAIAGGIKAKKTSNEREKGLQLPGLEDPGQTSRLLEIERIGKNVAAGTDTATQTGLQQIAQGAAGTQSRLLRATGGASGATTDALLKAQKAAGAQANQTIAQGQSRLPFFMNLGQQIANRAEQRKLELQLLERAQVSGETSQKQKEDNVNANAAIASGGLDDAAKGIGDTTSRIKALLNRNKQGGSSGLIADPNAQISTDAGLGGGPFPGKTEVPINMGTFGGVGSGFGG